LAQEESQDLMDKYRIGDILLSAVNTSLPHYRNYLKQAPIFIAMLDELYRTKKLFQNAYSQVFYLIITIYMHRLLVVRNYFD